MAVKAAEAAAKTSGSALGAGPAAGITDASGGCSERCRLGIEVTALGFEFNCSKVNLRSGVDLCGVPAFGNACDCMGALLGGVTVSDWSVPSSSSMAVIGMIGVQESSIQAACTSGATDGLDVY